MTRVTRFTFDWQLVPFALSAVLGLILAYNQPMATIRFTLIAIGVLLYLICANGRDSETRSIVRALLIALPALLTIYFVLTNDWAESSNKLAVLNALPALVGGAPRFNPNVIGGVLAMLLPLQIKALAQHRRSIKIGLIALTLIGLALSLTRGAWLALSLVGCLWFAWRWLNRRVTNQRTVRLVWLTGVVVLAVIGGVILFATPLGDRMLGLGGDRVNIWHNSLSLAGDYALTGFGLGSFEMVYSSYALLIHVGHTLHAHNVWLNIWLEQGGLGLVAFSGLVLAALWPKSDASIWRTAALASLGVVLIHTLFDDPFYGYGGAGIPLLFIPLGLLQRPAELAVPKSDHHKHKLQPALALWSTAFAGLIALVVLPQGRAVIEANLGAVAQTRAELSLYRWPDVPIQDVLRQSTGVDESAAIQHYNAALTLDAGNATANRRWAQIELARGEYDSACAHLHTAYTARPDQRATRQLLGECLALQAQNDQAVELWSSIDVSEGQLDIRYWWYDSYLHDADRAARLRQAQAALRQFQSSKG